MTALLLGLLGAVPAGVAAGGLVFTALSYRAGQRWKRAELARQLVERLSVDDELAFCTRALDWGVGPLVIPEKHRPLFADGQIVMEHDLNVLRQAVQPSLQPKWRAPEALTYRHSFDAFFTYLLRVAEQVRTGHVISDELVGLDYYLKLVAAPPYLRRLDESNGDAAAARSIFQPFVAHFYPKLVGFIWPDQSPLISNASQTSDRESLPAPR
jgi:hypothetical protein